VDILMTKPALFSQDDRILEGAGRQATAEVNRFFSKDRLELDERQRLARELHDGVLQSLAGAALQLEAISRLIDIDTKVAQEHLRAVGEVIAGEQRELRRWIERLQPPSSASIATGTDLATALEKLRERAEWQWGFKVELSVDGAGTVPRTLGDEIYRIVQEAFTNAGRHAHARLVRASVTLGTGSDPVRIIVSDDGCGFPFRGVYDHSELAARRIGPRSLRERVALLGGELVITTEHTGPEIDVTLPRAQQSARRAPRSGSNR
jgi:signal transduction histidine kinase